MSFKALRGQQRAVSFLRSALEGDRLAHAYLFSGPAGVGKRLLARELAKAVLCSSGNHDGCDQCRSCHAIDSGNSMEFTEIPAVDEKKNRRPLSDADRIIKVASVRALEEEFYLSVANGRMRVALLPGAERMNEEAQNALLKTLEEPAGSRLMILTSSNPDALLPTVISRVGRVRLRRLSDQEVATFLVEEKGISPETAAVTAAASGGSIGQALAADLEEVSAIRDFVIRNISVEISGDKLALAEKMVAQARELVGSSGKLEEVRGRLLSIFSTAAEMHRRALWSQLGAEELSDNRELLALASRGERKLRNRLEALLQAERALGANASIDLVCRVLAGELSCN